MSAAVGNFSASKEIGFNKNETKNEDLRDNENNKFVDEAEENDHHKDEDDHHESEHDEEDDAKLISEKALDLGPQFSLKEQLEKDKVCMISFPFHFSYLLHFAILSRYQTKPRTQYYSNSVHWSFYQVLTQTKH